MKEEPNKDEQNEDYTNWTVAEARRDCEKRKLELVIANGDPSDTRIEQAIIKQNSPGSKPGEPVVGGIVSIVIFPLEPRRKPDQEPDQRPRG